MYSDEVDGSKITNDCSPCGHLLGVTVLARKSERDQDIACLDDSFGANTTAIGVKMMTIA
jgi:hypothetical protein